MLKGSLHELPELQAQQIEEWIEFYWSSPPQEMARKWTPLAIEAGEKADAASMCLRRCRSAARRQALETEVAELRDRAFRIYYIAITGIDSEII